MSNARCTSCESDDVEYIGLKHGIDEYYCHNCETYFTVNWDEQDALEALRDPEEADRNAQGHDETDEEYEEQY